MDVSFAGTLRRDQDSATDVMMEHDTGILCAPTAFGKTVTAAALIARRGVNTLMLVHGTQLIKQWQERPQAFLNVDKGMVGTTGGGKAKPSGKIDIAAMQSLSRQGEGFDHLPLDTLVLAMLISWKGTLQQYAGRLHREHAAKIDVRIIDFMDLGHPALLRMWEKRQRGYRAMGYRIANQS